MSVSASTFHAYEAMVPVAVLVKTTSKGCKPEVGVAVKFATGAGSTGSVGEDPPPPPPIHTTEI